MATIPNPTLIRIDSPRGLQAYGTDDGASGGIQNVAGDTRVTSVNPAPPDDARCNDRGAEDEKPRPRAGL